MAQAMILTGLLAEAGYGSATFEQMQSAERVISAAFDRGRDTDVWMLDEEGFAQFATIASTYDYQLQRAPLSAIAEARYPARMSRFCDWLTIAGAASTPLGPIFPVALSCPVFGTCGLIKYPPSAPINHILWEYQPVIPQVFLEGITAAKLVLHIMSRLTVVEARSPVMDTRHAADVRSRIAVIRQPL